MTFFGGQRRHTIVCSVIIEPIFITSKSTHFTKRRRKHQPIAFVLIRQLTIWINKCILQFYILRYVGSFGNFFQREIYGFKKGNYHETLYLNYLCPRVVHG